MKKGKEEKSMGPMFPRLHVNDTEKGGPRAPPRNKMALYEQLSIPSQRFNPGVLPQNPNKTANLASSSQGNGQEKANNFPVHLPHSTYSTERRHDRLSYSGAPLVQPQQKQLDEDDFMVPIFVNSGLDHDTTVNRMDKETHPSFSPAIIGHKKFQNARVKDPKQASITGHNLSHEGRNQGEENPKEKAAIKEQPVKSCSSLSVREKTLELPKQIISSSDQEHKEHRAGNFNRSQDIDARLHQEYRVRSQLHNTVCGTGVSIEPTRDRENKSFSLSPRREFPHGREMSFGNAVNRCKDVEDEACDSLQQGNVDGGDDVSEISVVDSLSGLDISPDDVVGIIGQKHFWKARKAIVNQQRAFAVQVFELHRLIEVQRMIAGSPHLLLEGNAYMAKSLEDSPAKTLPLEYVVKPPHHVLKRKNDPEKPNHTIECSAESEVEKTTVSSYNNCNQPSSYVPFPANTPPTPITADPRIAPWFHQSPGNQWLMPVMSPSEGLIYKPYSGPSGFMGPVCGGYGPPGATPVMGNFVNPAYGFQPMQYPGMGIPAAGHGYFPPYGMMPAISGSYVEQTNNFAGRVSHLHPSQLPRGIPNVNVPRQIPSNVPDQRDGAISNIAKVRESKESELQGSTASSPGERAQVGTDYTAAANVLPLFPSSPVNCAPEGDARPLDSDQTARVIKVVPRNARIASPPEGEARPLDSDQTARVIKVVPRTARTATESAAWIFQSIQEERRQYDMD